MSQVHCQGVEDARPREDDERCWFGDPADMLAQRYVQAALDQGFPRFIEDSWVIAQIADMIQHRKAKP